MTRLPYLRRDTLDSKGQALWDAITATRGQEVVNAEGGLIGPFNAWLTAPDAGTHLANLGAVLRFGTSIERRLLELAIITVGARWHAEFEWWAHSKMALDNGVAPDIIDAIQHGDVPIFASDDERIVHAVAHQLATAGRVDEATFKAAQKLVGDQGMVELVSLCGYYTLVSFTLNTFDVPLPPGQTRTWND